MGKLKDFLRGMLEEEKIRFVPSSIEIIGSKEKAVAIVEIPEEIEDKAEIIGAAIMKIHKNVKSVLQKTSKRKGEFRLREFKVIAGMENTEVVHKEYGYLLKLDPRKVYFSAREGFERQRIASQVKENEKVLVMFSGVAPFAIAIAKKQPKVEKIVCIELNPEAHKYAEENVRINKLSHKIILIKGDVREVCKRFPNSFDRIVMPLPMHAEDFLDLAIYCLKKKGIIHFYSWSEEDKIQETEERLKKRLKSFNVNFLIISRKKVLPYAPRKWKIVFDIEVRK